MSKLQKWQQTAFPPLVLQELLLSAPLLQRQLNIAALTRVTKNNNTLQNMSSFYHSVYDKEKLVNLKYTTTTTNISDIR